jgi:outer membrane protein assembly factor BamB
MSELLFVVDENTGELIWEFKNSGATTLAISPTMLFVGKVGSVVAVNLASPPSDPMWRRAACPHVPRLEET